MRDASGALASLTHLILKRNQIGDAGITAFAGAIGSGALDRAAENAFMPSSPIVLSPSPRYTKLTDLLRILKENTFRSLSENILHARVRRLAYMSLSTTRRTELESVSSVEAPLRTVWNATRVSVSGARSDRSYCVQ